MNLQVVYLETPKGTLTPHRNPYKARTRTRNSRNPYRTLKGPKKTPRDSNIP